MAATSGSSRSFARDAVTVRVVLAFRKIGVRPSIAHSAKSRRAHRRAGTFLRRVHRWAGVSQSDVVVGSFEFARPSRYNRGSRRDKRGELAEWLKAAVC